MDRPKYKCGDLVKFHCPKQVSWGGKVLAEEEDIIGSIEIVDVFGTFEQNEEPSYDIFRKSNNTLYKHIRQSEVLEYIGEASLEDRPKW